MSATDLTKNVQNADFVNKLRMNDSNPRVAKLLAKMTEVMDPDWFEGLSDADVDSFLKKFESWVDTMRFDSQLDPTVNFKP